MIIYFEDGPLNDYLVDKDCIKIDAAFGYSKCRKALRESNKLSHDTKIYTNSMDAFSNFWAWDNQKQTPMIYLRDKNKSWVLIKELTNRQLRQGLNLEKLFVSGEFCKVET